MRGEGAAHKIKSAADFLEKSLTAMSFRAQARNLTAEAASMLHALFFEEGARRVGDDFKACGALLFLCAAPHLEPWTFKP